jgi:type IV secretion system protein VirD4
MSGNIATTIKKYAAPNIPYLFIGWAFLKLGTAFRTAPGANIGEQLMNTMQTIGPAFADFSPGTDLFDWLVGIVGAVLIRVYVHQRTKKARKYRRDAEYGTARWGTSKDIAPFVQLEQII